MAFYNFENIYILDSYRRVAWSKGNWNIGYLLMQCVTTFVKLCALLENCKKSIDTPVADIEKATNFGE